MWLTESIWFEVAVVNSIFAIGNILFGHFEEQTSKVKRISKYLLILVIVISLSIYFSRTAAMLFLGICLVPAIYIHTVILPKNGINGWTGEPREKYYDFRGWDKQKLYKHKEGSKDNVGKIH